MSEFTSEEEDSLTGIFIFCSVFSLCGSMFIIMVYWCCPKLQSFAFKLVFYMAVCDFINAVGGTIGGSVDDGNHASSCRFQAFLLQFGSLGSVLWTFVISHCIMEVVITRNHEVEDNLPYYHAFVWSVTTIISLLPFATDSYGPSNGWCWIHKDTDIGVVWRMLCFYVPLWLVIAWIVWVYYRTIRQLENSMQQTLNRMKYYPAVLVMAYFFATVNRVSQMFVEPDFVLACLHAFFSSLAGFFNALIYGWTPTVRQEVMKCFKDDNINARLIDFDDDYEYHDADGSYKPPQTHSAVETENASLSSQVIRDSEMSQTEDFN